MASCRMTISMPSAPLSGALSVTSWPRYRCQRLESPSSTEKAGLTLSDSEASIIGYKPRGFFPGGSDGLGSIGFAQPRSQSLDDIDKVRVGARRAEPNFLQKRESLMDDGKARRTALDGKRKESESQAGPLDASRIT